MDLPFADVHAHDALAPEQASPGLSAETVDSVSDT